MSNMEFAKLRAPRALLPYLPHVPRALVPHMPHVLRALVLNVPRAYVL